MLSPAANCSAAVRFRRTTAQLLRYVSKPSASISLNTRQRATDTRLHRQDWYFATSELGSADFQWCLRDASTNASRKVRRTTGVSIETEMDYLCSAGQVKNLVSYSLR